MSEIVDVVAALASALFAGAAVYINLVEHPARMSCGTEIAIRQWAPSYKRATVVQVTLAVVATLAGLARWLQKGDSIWLYGAACILAVVLFTLIAILPTNHRLLEPGRDPRSEETRRLLEKWGRLHAVRSLLSLVADYWRRLARSTFVGGDLRFVGRSPYVGAAPQVTVVNPTSCRGRRF